MTWIPLLTENKCAYTVIHRSYYIYFKQNNKDTHFFFGEYKDTQSRTNYLSFQKIGL